MGLKVPDLPDDYGYGDDCLRCWAADQTPNYVFVVFHDIDTCPGNPQVPNGQTFTCKQHPFQPCRWSGKLDWHGVEWECVYWSSLFVDPVWISLVSLIPVPPPSNTAFYNAQAECTLDFVNVQTCVGGFGGEGGHAHVTCFIDPIIIALTSEYHFVTTPGVLYEFDSCGMDHRWYRLCHKIDHTNIMILLDVEELELPW